MSSQVRTPEVVLEQVVKLLNVTVEKGATTAEAASAAAKAQALMFTYNLEEADVTKSRRGKVSVDEQAFGLLSDSWRGDYYWQRELVEGIARFNFCMVLSYKSQWNPKARTRVVSAVTIIGHKQNVEVVEYLYAYLYREVSRLARKTRREAIKAALAELSSEQRERFKNSHSWLGVPGTQVWERSFGEGAVAEIIERLRVQRLADAAGVTAEQGQLIVTLDRDVEEVWYHKRYGKSKAAFVAEQQKRDELAAERAQQAAARQAELEQRYVSGELKRPRVTKERVRYASSREQYDYRAEGLGRAHGKQIAIRTAVDGDAAVAPKELTS